LEESELAASQKFFDERSDQSEVKARIVQKYFYVWAKVVGPTAKSMGNKIAYIDLYAGPGRYKDGSASTPLLVLENATADPQLASTLVTIFNDENKDCTDSLQNEIEKLPSIGKLKYKPQVMCAPIDEGAASYFEKTRLVPSFTFVDPFGYKGLSLKIVNGVIKDWGCDCVFFFNYNRINAGITNSAVDVHINALFGEERANKLRASLPGKTPMQREIIVLEELAQAIKSMGGKYVLPFRFKSASGARTSHSLIFVSKHFKGYEIMKDIMAKESSIIDQGVPSFTYSPAEASTPLLFSLARPYESLLDDICEKYAGQSISMGDIYADHSVDTPYIKRNYKEALIELEQSGALIATPKKRRAGTFADHVVATFSEN
jgi:three-Cys-motif partner protein